MLYTRKGDTGTTRIFNSKSGDKISKSSCQIESLGALDELNSFLGLVKVKARGVSWSVNGKKVDVLVNWLQNCLFTAQAEVAGSAKKITNDEIKEIELIIDFAEKEMPPIKTFFVSGGTELATLFDIARTLARKAERRVVGAREDRSIKVSGNTLAFLNRLSSVLYAMARFINFKSGVNEEAPWYN